MSDKLIAFDLFLFAQLGIIKRQKAGQVFPRPAISQAGVVRQGGLPCNHRNPYPGQNIS